MTFVAPIGERYVEDSGGSVHEYNGVAYRRAGDAPAPRQLFIEHREPWFARHRRVALDVSHSPGDALTLRVVMAQVTGVEIDAGPRHGDLVDKSA